MPGLEVAPKISAATVQVLGLGLVLREDNRKDSSSSTVALDLPDELPSFEDALKVLVAAVDVLVFDFVFKRRRQKKQFFFFFFQKGVDFSGSQTRIKMSFGPS